VVDRLKEADAKKGDSGLVESEVQAVVDYAARLPAEAGAHAWAGWQVRPLASGNNRLWRVTRAADDWVVKLTIRDDRDRARREYAALTLMAHAAPGIAPTPLYLDPDTYEQGVVVQTWVAGTPLWSPPNDDAAWLKVVQAYARVHAARRPDGAAWAASDEPLLRPATLAEARAGAHSLAQQLPPEGQTAPLAALLAALDALTLPDLPVTWGWGHGDANIRNSVASEGGVTLVDWEYSGVTDPAQEIAKLMSHPAAAGAGEARWAWVAETYAALSGRPAMRERVQWFYALRLAWWSVRLLFGRHVLLARPSHRLVGPGPELEMTTDETIALYFERARTQLAALASVKRE